MGRVMLTDGGWTLETADLPDCFSLSGRLRDEDLMELRAVSGKSPLQVLEDSVNTSDMAFTVKKRGVPMMIFGVARRSLLTGTDSCCWALSAKEMGESGSAFLRHCRGVIVMLNRCFPVMSNYVGVWNRRTLRWLRWCGFTVSPPRRVGIHGEYMHRVERRFEG